MASDHDNVHTLAKEYERRYEEYRSSAQELNSRFRCFQANRMKHFWFPGIMRFDKQISELCDRVLNLVIDVEVLRAAKSASTESDLDPLYGDASSLLRLLESLHRLNTHIYVVFSVWLAIGIAALPLLAGVLSLLAGIGHSGADPNSP